MHEEWISKHYGGSTSVDYLLKRLVVLNKTMEALYMLGIVSKPPSIMKIYNTIIKLHEGSLYGTSCTDGKKNS